MWARVSQSLGASGAGFRAAGDHTHRQRGSPQCFLWLSDCCKEGLQALPEGWCYITNHHLLFQHSGHERRTWFMSVWPGVASLELISKKERQQVYYYVAIAQTSAQ